MSKNDRASKLRAFAETVHRMMGDLGEGVDIRRYEAGLQLLETEVEGSLQELRPHPDEEPRVREILIRIGATGMLIGRGSAGEKSARKRATRQRILAELAEAMDRATARGEEAKLAAIDFEVADKMGCSVSLVEKVRLARRRGEKDYARRGSESQ
jgi:hypothetical protein